MNQVIDFIVNDAAFKLQKGMTRKPADKCDLFIDTSLFKLKMLSFIFWIDNDGIEAYAYDYRPDDDTLNYFINLSNEDRSAIEQRILNKIKGIEVSSAPDLSTMGVQMVSEVRMPELLRKFASKLLDISREKNRALTTEPPDGWRWLEVGEVIRKGDKPANGLGLSLCWIGTPCCGEQFIFRRNKFEVGEKVVEFINNRIGVVKDIEATGKGKAFLYHVEMQDTKGMILFSPHQLAPYIEEQS